MNYANVPDDDDAWVQVAGEVELIGGWAEVSLDEQFAASIDTSAYLVFVTSYGPASVFVQSRRPRSFEIHAIPAMGHRRHAAVQCAYQVVARRRAIASNSTGVPGGQCSPRPLDYEA